MRSDHARTTLRMALETRERKLDFMFSAVRILVQSFKQEICLT